MRDRDSSIYEEEGMEVRRGAGGGKEIRYGGGVGDVGQGEGTRGGEESQVEGNAASRERA
jgi:hypothetical protein